MWSWSAGGESFGLLEREVVGDLRGSIDLNEDIRERGPVSIRACLVLDSYLGRFRSDRDDGWCFENPTHRATRSKDRSTSPETCSVTLKRWRGHDKLVR